MSDRVMNRRTVIAGGSAAALTLSLRYADGVIDAARGRWIGVREDHTTGAAQPVNALVAVDLRTGGPGTVLVQGSDFYAAPRLSPDGTRLYLARPVHDGSGSITVVDARTLDTLGPLHGYGIARRKNQHRHLVAAMP